MIKLIIVILFVAMLISLTGGLRFLLKDVGSSSKRTLYALGIRAVIAALLLGTLFYGFYSGQLKSGAPWEQPAAYSEKS